MGLKTQRLEPPKCADGYPVFAQNGMTRIQGLREPAADEQLDEVTAAA